MFDVMTRKASIGVAILAALVAIAPAPASGKMQSVKLGKKVCQTTGGGKFVDIPGFPGEKIDRRLLRDIRMFRRKYNIFITDGYSTDPVHSANGEHPRGLALDIVPYFSKGGSWNDIDRLAAFAEPTQNQPRSPFRWVGYNGDAHHGRGHHLHLSYSHSGAAFGQPAKTIYSVKCPRKKKRPDTTEEPTTGDGSGSKDSNTGGGISSGGRDSKGGDGDGKGGKNSGGGIGTRSAPTQLAPIAPETNGVGL